MIALFKVRSHFGRFDYYPVNEVARFLLTLKKAFRTESFKRLVEVKCLNSLEFETLKKAGVWDLQIVVDSAEHVKTSNKKVGV